MTEYPQIVSAAAQATEAILEIATSLARDIPAGSTNVMGRISEARREAMAAHGYVRSVKTWSDWRLVALWADCKWVEGVGIYGHQEAKSAGFSIEELRCSPDAVAEVKATREAAKQARVEEVKQKYAADVVRQAAEREARITAEREAREAQVAQRVAREAQVAAVMAPRTVISGEPVLPFVGASIEPVAQSWADEVKAQADAVRAVATHVENLRLLSPAPQVEARVEWADAAAAGMRAGVRSLLAQHDGDDEQVTRLAEHLFEIAEWVLTQVSVQA